MAASFGPISALGLATKDAEADATVLAPLLALVRHLAEQYRDVARFAVYPVPHTSHGRSMRHLLPSELRYTTIEEGEPA